jgi:maltose O-acetyltransferase
MVSGEPYLASDPELVAAREQCQELLARFNAGDGPPPLAAGDGAEILPPLRCDYGTNIRIGARSFVNYGAVLLDPAPIVIGEEVLLATNVQLITATHPLDPDERASGWETAFPIAVEDRAWLGAGAIVLPGRTIGREAIVGAGAVVTKDVAPRTVVAGNPARVIRRV